MLYYLFPAQAGHGGKVFPLPSVLLKQQNAERRLDLTPVFLSAVFAERLMMSLHRISCRFFKPTCRE